MTALKFYLNDDGSHEWYDLIHYRSIAPIAMRCGTSNLVPFCTHYESIGDDIDNVVIEYFNGGELELDSTAAFDVVSDGIHDWIIYYGTEVESDSSPLDEGLARFVIELEGGDILYSDYFEICDLDVSTSGSRLIYDDYFNIYFSARYDLIEPYRIIYQTDYENHHIFKTLPVNADHNYSVEGEIDEKQYEYIEYQSDKKMYQVEALGGEGLFDMLSILAFHEDIFVAWPGQEITQARNIEVESEWLDDYLCRMIIKFSFENIKKGTCDTDFDLT